MTFRNRAAALAVFFLTLSLLAASAVVAVEGASGARYAVAQCGWHVGHDSTWYDLSADKFSKSNYCQTPDSADPFDGVHQLSQTRSATRYVGGTKFATWRWQAPAGVGIVNVHGQRWQYLRDGFQHRIGGVAPGTGFSPFLELSSTDSNKRDFSAGFWPFAEAFESRLVCYKTSGKNCAADGTVLAGVRALTLTLDDSGAPVSQISGGLTTGGWLKGGQSLSFSNGDSGSGLRFADSYVDGTVLARSEMTCSKVLVNGQWRGTKMRPCPTGATGIHSLSTTSVSDGPHRLQHCGFDFAGNAGCAGERTFLVDNNAPTAPRNLTVAGGEGWHRTNGFDLTWNEPDQGAGSPIVGSFHKISGAGGFQAGPVNRVEPGVITGIQVPGPGEFQVKVWLADQAGNVDESREAGATLRLDDVPPIGYFEDPPQNDPGAIKVRVSDQHSGVASVTVAWRLLSGQEWQEIPGSLGREDAAVFQARVPEEAGPGPLVLRATVTDVAGNVTTTDTRANGSQMVVSSPVKNRTILTAGLSRGSRSAVGKMTVGYKQWVRLTGRLTSIGSGGLGGAELELTEVPFVGTKAKPAPRAIRTDERGYFDVRLEPGPGRRLRVDFRGNRELQPATSGNVELAVRGKLTFKVKPKRLVTGAKVKFRGRVSARGAWHPTRGNLIQIQYYEGTARRWRPVAWTRTGRDGRYRSSYRFRYITGLARIKLRAQMFPSPRFPYVRATSKPATIRVRG